MISAKMISNILWCLDTAIYGRKLSSLLLLYFVGLALGALVFQLIFVMGVCDSILACPYDP